jgi:hypothetical protein
MDEEQRRHLRAELYERQRKAYESLGLARPGRYLHGVHLQDLARWNNFVQVGWHFASGWAELDPAFAGLETVRETSIAKLRDDPPANVTTAFAGSTVYTAALIRRFGRVGRGVEHTVWLTEAEKQGCLAAADVELLFEKERRRTAPDAASRLASLFVVDDTPAGERHLREMLGASPDIMALRVEIPAAIRFTKADTRWLEAAWKDPEVELAEQYWAGTRFSAEEDRWEYLVEGILRMTSKKQLVKLRQAGAMALGMNVESP